jgi:exodeoxyribonuclease-3
VENRYDPLKLITWNVNGIRARFSELVALSEAERPDIICLQEIKATPAQIPDVLVAAADYWCYWHGGGGYSGVAMLIRRSLAAGQPVFSHPAFDMEHRICVVDLGAILTASIYVPNGGKDYPAKLRFLEGLAAWADETQRAGRTLLLCGDLNVAFEDRDVHPKERKPNQVGTRPDERGLLGRLFQSSLVDIGRTLDPLNDELYTWWAPWRNLRQRNIGWRIDYVLASPGLAGRASAAVSRREFGTSDHAPVVVTFGGRPGPTVI